MAKFTITLKAARVNAGKTIKETARNIGISDRTLVNYESGQSVPNHLMAQKLATFYGIPLDRIFFGQQSALSVQNGGDYYVED